VNVARARDWQVMPSLIRTKGNTMDINATLYEITENLGVFWNASTPRDTRLSTAEHIIEHFEYLNEWLAKGGFLPTAWER
jgi:hypothetical protein